MVVGSYSLADTVAVVVGSYSLADAVAVVVGSCSLADAVAVVVSSSSLAGTVVVYRARPSLPRVILLSHALNYKRVWRGGRESLAEVISIHEALTNQIAVQNPCHGLHLGASIVSRIVVK